MQYRYSEGAMSNDAACNYLLHKNIGPHSLSLPAWSSWSRNKEKIKRGNFFIHSMCLYSICVCIFINTYKHRHLYIHTQTHRLKTTLSTLKKIFNKSIFYLSTDLRLNFWEFLTTFWNLTRCVAGSKCYYFVHRPFRLRWIYHNTAI